MAKIQKATIALILVILVVGCANPTERRNGQDFIAVLEVGMSMAYLKEQAEQIYGYDILSELRPRRLSYGELYRLCITDELCFPSSLISDVHFDGVLPTEEPSAFSTTGPWTKEETAAIISFSGMQINSHIRVLFDPKTELIVGWIVFGF